ncbi:MAG TPA: pantoate--beta-alanine ligase [Acidimicrobiales bacterium]|nr:pantoate--beta-alanine ligase [Acidimicrobiales bacterium]
MIVTEEADELRRFLDGARSSGKVVGFHLTTGALHGGHRSNIRKMAAECDVSAVSIFASPLQFGPCKGPRGYPRDLDGDLAQAEEAGADVVLAPKATWDVGCSTAVRVKGFEAVLEGRSLPGYFEGVATVVTKLLSAVGPCYAYFGEKDYQQLVLVRRLVEDLSLAAAVVACPVVRETDGLALSSRNCLLSPDERAGARALYWSLLAGKRAIEEKGITAPKLVRSAMLEVASREPLFDLDYAVVADPEQLEEPEVIDGEVRLLIAGRLGRTRLIDNVGASRGED